MGKKSSFIEFDSSPWTPLKIPVRKSKIAFVTTGGIYTADQDPFDMTDPDGDSTFREIPADTKESQLRVSHKVECSICA